MCGYVLYVFSGPEPNVMLLVAVLTPPTFTPPANDISVQYTLLSPQLKTIKAIEMGGISRLDNTPRPCFDVNNLDRGATGKRHKES